eukprot:4609430-Heterocapsa_arctica.AAC.1
MAIRKSKVIKLAMKLNDGRFSSPETLVWEIVARGELSRLTGTFFVAAYIDCVKCYELVKHNVAAKMAVKTGCNSTIVKLSFQMCNKPRVGQVHKANAALITANRGMLAGCGYVVHYLKDMIKEDVKEEGNELIHVVDDMVLLKESDTEIGAVEGIMKDLDNTKGRLTDIGQRLNDSKEQIVVPNKSMEQLWNQVLPD